MDNVTAGLAIAVSAIAVLAGIERWLLPARHQRQYTLFTQMRDGETDKERWESLNEIRISTAAGQAAAYWVSTTRLLTWALICAALMLGLWSTVTAGISAIPFAVSFAVGLYFAVTYLFYLYALRWHFVREHVRGHRLGQNPMTFSNDKDMPKAIKGVAALTVALPVAYAIDVSDMPEWVGFIDLIVLLSGIPLWLFFVVSLLASRQKPGPARGVTAHWAESVGEPLARLNRWFDPDDN